MYSNEQQFAISCLGIVSPKCLVRNTKVIELSDISKINECRNTIPNAVMPINEELFSHS